jgi:WD40 repeat protein
MPKPFRIGKSYSLAVSCDGARLAALGRYVFMWDLSTRQKLFRCKPFAHPSHACFSPNGAYLAVKSTAGRIVIIASDDGRTVADFNSQSDGEGSNVVYSSCCGFVVDGSWEGFIRARRALAGDVVFEAMFPDEMILAIHRDGTGRRWFVSHQPKTRRSEQFAPPAYFSTWEWPFEPKSYSILPYRYDHLYSSALSGDACYLAVVHGVRGASSAVLELHGLANPALHRTLPITSGGTGSALRFSPDGSWLGSVQGKRTAIYRIPDLSCIAEFALPYPSDIAFSPELNLAVLGDWQNGIVIPTEM